MTGPGVTTAFSPVDRAFRRLVGGRSGGGALVVRMDGVTVVDLVSGWADRARTRPWTRETVALSFSTTKGVASTVIHRLADRGLIGYDEPVAAYWPEFGAGGKDKVTVRELLSHRAGLHNVQAVAAQAEDILDHLAMEEKLAARTVRAPTSYSAYHGITYGWLLAGLARRVTGQGLAELARTEVVEPLGLHGMHIGVPAEARDSVAEIAGTGLRQVGRVAQVLSPLTMRTRPGRTAFEALVVPGFHRIFEGREPPIWTTEMPAVNGMFSADALARMYGALANGGSDDGRTLLSPETTHELGKVQVRTRDAALGIRMRWRLGYHHALGAGRDAPQAFGHYGFGGSGGWANPELGLSLGFVTNRIGSATTPMADATLYRLTRVVMQCARAA